MPPSGGICPAIVSGPPTRVGQDGLTYTLFSAPPFVVHRTAIDFCAALDPGQRSILAGYITQQERAVLADLCAGCGCWVLNPSVNGFCPLLGADGAVVYVDCAVNRNSFVCKQGRVP